MTSTPESNPNPLIWSAPATVALCVVGPIAVYAGCHRSLKKYICFTEQAGISTDTKHKLDVSTSEPGLASEAEPVAKGKAQSALSRWVTWLKGASLVVAIFSVALGIGVGLHLLATPTILDVFWIVLMTFQTGILVSNAINTALPDPRVMDVRWTAWNSITWTVTGPDPKSPVPNTKARLIATSLVTLLSISGVYTGHTWLTAIPIMAFVYDSISCRTFGDMSFRKMIKWVLYFQIFMSTAILLLLGAISMVNSYMSSASDASDTKPSKFSQPSPEGQVLMSLYQKAAPLIAPGVFVAYGLRFDYIQAKKTMGVLAPSNGATVNSHDIVLPSFPRPMFREGMKVYILQLVLFTVAYGSNLPFNVKNCLPIIEPFGIPIWPVVIRQMLVARRLGIYKELMDYSEPRLNKDVPEAKEVKEEEDVPGDIEKAALSADVKS